MSDTMNINGEHYAVEYFYRVWCGVLYEADG